MTFTKSDGGKARLGLIPPEAIEAIGAAFSEGAKKYSPHNWRDGADWSRYLDAALRHLNAWNAGEDLDRETGLSHLAHSCACLMILIGSQDRGLGRDDRWRPAK